MANDSDFKADMIVRTAAEWQSLNPFLDKNDLGIESDTGRKKVGVGVKWSATAYLPPPAGVSAVVTYFDTSYQADVELTFVAGVLTTVAYP